MRKLRNTRIQWISNPDFDLHISLYMINETSDEMVIVVTSDQHLGYSNSNVNDFFKFLVYILERKDVTDFVILGDFVDMWRRDISGIFLENHDILEKILDIKSKTK